MRFWSRSGSNHPPNREMLGHLERIGIAKNQLPWSQRGWCNELGLFVQMQYADETELLQAGGKFRPRIQLRRDPGEEWTAAKYHPGRWESLVYPTEVLAMWLQDRNGLPNYLEHDLVRAKARFQLGRGFDLPLGARTIGEGRLAQAAGIDVFVGSFNPTAAENGLRKYLTEFPDNATAWDALRESQAQLREFERALAAGLEAARLAPNDGDIHLEVARIYCAALSNDDVRFTTPIGFCQEWDGCTLEVLGCVGSEAVRAARAHLAVAVGAPATEVDYRKVAKLLLADLSDRAEDWWTEARTG